MTITKCKYYRDKDKECDVWGIPCEMKDCYFKELKRLEQENEKLKEEVEIKDNISEDFRKKALEWAEIANNYFKENSRLYKVLQEIKAIAENCMNKDVCYDCEYFDDCHIEDAEIPTYDICKLLIQKITKAEEE